MSQRTLDTVSTILGIVAGGATLLGNFHVINPQTAGTIGGIATAVLGYLVQRPASDTKAS
ncbi:hypothetical protein [Nostoc sp. FACHB-110]|uniref:hypothetical protein n=1 Tax=Nostoc sp. FACHB-110 TaxID=2692834 RepID=UPI00168588F0|nr:hypothetical protein [Nostoc sp. FACHB-110]MBD2437349.1 hypothetical protein [Nostoc sp. FACHB-110]